ncbi:MAG: carboxylesterase family protein [Candidatus Aphodousia sp.]|nr:carboxylesterase family protein [Sutterella sp.]MDY2899543.1 carboxylesterase family protein [Candidatus Aphodousia sp.]
MKELELSTSLGRLKGLVREEVAIFDGVPYAAAPVRENRFKVPQPVCAWEGVRDCTKNYPVAPQSASDLEAPMGAFHREQSEDCLTLRICTPDVKAKLPVAVWFHGGANMSGAGNIEWYDGFSLAKRGPMVIVGVNFRIAALGFLYHEAFNTENLSIQDQIAALRWIQDHIAEFGGDPNNVTLFGQSAGGNAIVHMMSLAETEGLFHKVILESPSIGRANHTTADAAEVAECILGHMGLDVKAEQFKEQLLEKTPEEFLQASLAAYGDLGKKYAGMLFKPVMDAWSTTQTTIEAAVREAARRHLKIVIGTTADEVHAFTLGRDPESEKVNHAVQNARYDLPAQEFAARVKEAGCDVWKYRFTWKAKDSIYDSCHTIELPFVFGTFDAWREAAMLAGTTDEEADRLTETMQSLWCQFITHGSFDASVWPQYSRENPQHKIIDNAENGIQTLVFK